MSPRPVLVQLQDLPEPLRRQVSAKGKPRGRKRVRNGRVIGDDPQARFRWLCKAAGLPMPVTEHRFHPKRRWRWDYAWVEERLALEVDGGLYVGGAHVRGARVQATHEKLNAAAVLGWRVLYCVPRTLHSDSTLSLLRAALNQEMP